MQKLRFLFRKISNVVTDIIYPKHCVVCGGVIYAYNNKGICTKCMQNPLKLKVVRDDRYSFDEAVAVLKYDTSVKRAMINYKFKSVAYYGAAYAHIMDTAVADRQYLKNAIMCPVPLSATRDRDYSQTLLIAQGLSTSWECILLDDLLIRRTHVKQLSKMTLPERKFYINGAFDVNPCYDIYGKDVLIIDDIFTSGTTVNECARVLKMYGARKVYVLCPCYD